MIPIKATAQFNPDGEISVEQFTWQGVDYPIISTGRSWQDDRGYHILVMVPDNQIYELIFVAGELIWYLGNLGGYRFAA